MPTIKVNVGEPVLMAQNVVHALPACRGHITASAAIEASQDGSTFAALTGANTTGVETSSRFIRCTGAGGATVTFKKA